MTTTLQEIPLGLATEAHVEILKDIATTFGLADSSVLHAIQIVITCQFESKSQTCYLLSCSFFSRRALYGKVEALTSGGNDDGKPGTASWRSAAVKMTNVVFDEMMKGGIRDVGGIWGQMALLGSCEAHKKLISHTRKRQSMNGIQYIVIHMLHGIQDAVEKDKFGRCSKEDAEKLCEEILRIGKRYIIEDLKPTWGSKLVVDEVFWLFNVFANLTAGCVDISVEIAKMIIEKYSTQKIVDLLRDSRLHPAAHDEGVQLLALHGAKNHECKIRSKPDGKWVMEALLNWLQRGTGLLQLKRADKMFRHVCDRGRSR